MRKQRRLAMRRRRIQRLAFIKRMRAEKRNTFRKCIRELKKKHHHKISAEKRLKILKRRELKKSKKT